MAPRFGYAGKLLRVNLTSREISETPSRTYLPKYFGGRGLAARLYWDEVSAEVGPLEPDNRLIFTAGPLTGTGAAMTSVSQCAAKAPMIYPISTYFVCSATGMWAHEMKYAGYDAIIIQGKASEPVYVWIEDDHVEIRSAGFLWGRTTRRTRQDLMTIHGYKVQVACIGPAGERLVIPSIIAVDSNTAFGQGGLGAVMGSKNLKAIALRGTGRIYVANPRKILELNETMRKLASIKAGETRVLADGRTVVGKHEPAVSSCLEPIRGLSTKIAQEEALGQVRIRRSACPGCFITCKSKREYADGSLPSGSAECGDALMWLGQEKEFFGGWTSGRLTWEWSMLNDDLGLDCYHTGCTSFAYGRPFGREGHTQSHMTLDLWLEAYKRGILTEANTGLPWSRFGGPEFMRELVYSLAYRKGFGEILARGAGPAVRYIQDHEEFGPRRGEMEYLYQKVYPKAGTFGGTNRHNIRKSRESHPLTSLYTAVNSKRGKELHAVYGTQPKEWLAKFYGSDKIADMSYWGDEVAKAAVLHEYYANEADSAPVCAMNSLVAGLNGADAWGGGAFARSNVENFLKYSLHGTVEYLSAVFGKETSQEELFAKDEMIVNLERAIWIRDGYLRGEVDTFFDCVFEEAHNGEVLIPKEKLEKLLGVYYDLRGWERGVPTRATLERLGLRDVADELEGRGVGTGEISGPM